MLRYLIATPINDDESVGFVKLRDKYKSYAPKWHITLDPHITIVRPSPAQVSLDMAIELFELSNMPKEFRVNFSEFDAFLSPDSCCVYAKPDDILGFERLNELFLPVSKKILNLDPNDWPFLPHLTLINRLHREAAMDLLEALRREKVALSYLIDRVVLFKKDDTDSVWLKVAECVLTKG